MVEKHTRNKLGWGDCPLCCSRWERDRRGRGRRGRRDGIHDDVRDDVGRRVFEGILQKDLRLDDEQQRRGDQRGQGEDHEEIEEETQVTGWQIWFDAGFCWPEIMSRVSVSRSLTLMTYCNALHHFKSTKTFLRPELLPCSFYAGPLCINLRNLCSHNATLAPSKEYRAILSLNANSIIKKTSLLKINLGYY